MIAAMPPGFPLWKRVFDLCLTIPGLILISPVLLAVSISILLIEGKPILFRQERPGYKGQIFTIYKFRTMRISCGRDGKPLPDGARISPLGGFLRKTSLDELPEFFNVFKGDMSLVGPRPLLIAYLSRYSAEQARRHDTPPGITGWAQINGRNALNWEDRFRHDVWYVEHRSLALDIKILLASIWKTIRMEGISQPGHATVEEFMGSKPSQKTRNDNQV